MLCVVFVAVVAVVVHLIATGICLFDFPWWYVLRDSRCLIQSGIRGRLWTAIGRRRYFFLCGCCWCNIGDGLLYIVGLLSCRASIAIAMTPL